MLKKSTVVKETLTSKEWLHKKDKRKRKRLILGFTAFKLLMIEH